MSSAVKQIAQITGARISTVTNWYQGKNVPGARYLLLLARSSPTILRFVLMQIGGELLLDAYGIFASRATPANASKIPNQMPVFQARNVSKNGSMAPPNGFTSLFNQRQQWFISKLETDPNVTAADIVTYWKVGVRTAWRDIEILKRTRRIIFVGSKRSGQYRVAVRDDGDYE
ncbi:hypothetical protein ABAC460_17135 [Asticcacaulis sp. AC460]|nr:hypothetical protein ABAC460_17135 [Asticcacaulis sp. AC460]